MKERTDACVSAEGASVAIEITETPPGNLSVIRTFLTDAHLSDADLEAYDFILTATENGRLVGCIGYQKGGPDWGHIQSLAVAKAERRRGIGSSLVTALLGKVQEDPEIRIVFALSLSFMNSGFYRGLGFRHYDKGIKQWDQVGRRKKHAHCTVYGICMGESAYEGLLVN